MNQILERLIALFDWVWSVSAMASVLVVLIIVLQRVLKHHLKPRWHYLMWLLVIVRLILPWGPESEFSIYNWIGTTDSIESVMPVNPAEILAREAVPETAAPTLYQDLFIVWLVGACLLGTYSIRINWKFARRIKKETVAITDARVLQLFDQCKKMMSIHKHVSLVESHHLGTPSLFGFLHPQLIMPTAILTRLDDDQLQHVFLHELAHRKRNDIWVNGFMQALLIIHWFNPVLWYASRRMQEDQEIASDALALSCLTPDQSRNYGYTLIKLLEDFSQPFKIAGNVNLTGNKTQLKRRIKMITQFKSNSYRWSFLGIATLLIISGCTLTNPKASQNATQPPNKIITEETQSPSTLTGSNLTISVDKSNTDELVEPVSPPTNDKSSSLVPVESEPTTKVDQPSSAPPVPELRAAASDERSSFTAPVTEQRAAEIKVRADSVTAAAEQRASEVKVRADSVTAAVAEQSASEIKVRADSTAPVAEQRASEVKVRADSVTAAAEQRAASFIAPARN
ncbi:M56 family metallopeptidase [Paenibacillus monticola]|uniref:Peptidase M56 domain-containing protein n=1 Tax=Paenibacillus monticola TaxID=2666075 RepID=A0A7X2H5V2_9BACL|nr:M56 family metallopeptidase [Paenibacillus monticola]MRN54005.1 hypothetical protein [Paenibacillus monticola]